jgi:hypothetical protein
MPHAITAATFALALALPPPQLSPDDGEIWI